MRVNFKVAIDLARRLWLGRQRGFGGVLKMVEYQAPLLRLDFTLVVESAINAHVSTRPAW